MRVAGGAIVICLLAGAGVGCKKPLHAPGESAGSTISRSLTPMVPHEALLVQSVLIEQPIGDEFLDRDLWAMARPVGEPETRALLAENGLRAGILSGTLPQRFQDLLDSDADTVSPNEMSFNKRKEAVIPTAGPVDPCRFAFLADLAGAAQPVEFKQARCGVLVRPRVEEGGRVGIYCEPQIKHGERRDHYRPNEDGTGFVKTEEMPLERFPKLGFDAVLGRGGLPGDRLERRAAGDARRGALRGGDQQPPAAARAGHPGPPARPLHAQRPAGDRGAVSAEALGLRAAAKETSRALLPREMKSSVDEQEQQSRR